MKLQIDDDAVRTIRSFAWVTGPSMAAWLLFLPPLALIGIRNWSLIWLILIPVTVASAASFFSVIRSSYGMVTQVVTLFMVLVAVSSVTMLYGPLIITPTLIGLAAIVIQAFPSRSMRRFGVALAVILMTGLVLLELGHVSSSYVFEGGRWSVLPQLVELPRTGTLMVLLVAHLSAMIVPAMFIGRLRRDLARAQQHQLLQAWHFRRLGDQLMRSRA